MVSLTGDKGTTGEITINALLLSFKNRRFKKGAYDDLIIECDGDLGDIQVVHAGLRYRRVLNIITPDWYIDFFNVHNYQSIQLKHFPCYHWIGQSIKDVTATSETGKHALYRSYRGPSIYYFVGLALAYNYNII